MLDQIARAGREGRIATYQVCDWKTPLAADVLLSRHYPGDGVIDFASLTRAVEATGYDGDIEVEIFNADIWATDPLARRAAHGRRVRGRRLAAPARAGRALSVASDPPAPRARRGPALGTRPRQDDSLVRARTGHSALDSAL